MSGTADRAAACIALTIQHEGGYVDHPKDPGGATRFGITLRTLQAARGNMHLGKDAVRNLTVAEATQIYRRMFWDRCRCSDLPPGVDMIIFDTAVHAGPDRAARMLQAAAGAHVDGEIGPQTIAAVRRHPDVSALVRDLCERRLEHLRSRPHWATFGKGWSRRCDAMRDAALGACTARPIG